jgi:methionine synthase II (cobalamin-independent)
MAVRFRADNIGSLLRPAELLAARAALREGRMDEAQVRELEDRSILTALAMQQAAGVQFLRTANIAGIFLPRISPERSTDLCRENRW